MPARRITVGGTDPGALEQWLTATLKVIESEKFVENLEVVEKRHGELWLSPFGGTISAARLAALYHGRLKGFPAFPAALRVTGAVGTARTIPGPARTAIIEVLPSHLEQWMSGETSARACAINTLAHEISHTVSTDAATLSYAIVDGKRWLATRLSRPLASYVVGAVAQCTYLEKPDSEAMLRCVEEFGLNQFYVEGCDE